MKILYPFLWLLMIPIIAIAKIAEFIVWEILDSPLERARRNPPRAIGYDARLQQITDAANHLQGEVIKAAYQLEQERHQNRSLMGDNTRLKEQVRNLQMKRN